jgi:DNA-binding MltR family transcriptional regulator
MTDSNLDEDPAEYFLRLLKETHANTHAATVLTISAKLDDGLQRLLLAKMRDISNRLAERLFSGYGPLGSFSAKIDVSYAFGLIGDDTFDDLKVIREIRNHFAHSLAVATFKTDEVIAMCKKFKKQEATEGGAFVIFWNRAGRCAEVIEGQVNLMIAADALRDLD